MNARAALLAALALSFVMVGTGCDNKEKAEKQSLINQNDELKKQLDAERARANAATAAAASASTPAPAADTMTPPAVDNGAPLDLTKDKPTAKGGSKDLGAGVSTHTNAAGEAVIEIKGDVLFDSGKATLKPSAKKSLDAVASEIKSRYGNDTLRIEGHTDPAPVKNSGWDDNWDLGSARANAVRAYLSTKGVKHMYIASFAATDLKSSKNQALNRRVDIVVVKTAK